MEFKARQFAQALLDKRDSQKIALRQAGKQVGLSAATLSRLETQKFLPDVLTYARCCKWLGLPMDYFMNDTKTIQIAIPENAQELQVVYFPCDPSDRALQYKRPMSEKDCKVIGCKAGRIVESEELPAGKWRLNGVANGLAILTEESN